MSQSNVEEDLPGWRVEVLPRSGKWILIFYVDGSPRGSVEIYTEEEKQAWIRLTSDLNERLGLKG